MLHVPSMEGLALRLELALPRRDGLPEELMGVRPIAPEDAHCQTENVPAFMFPCIGLLRSE